MLDREALEGASSTPTRRGSRRGAAGPGLPLVRADAAQLERAFANLIENAQRHAGRHPVQVRGRATGGRVLIRVVDRGAGSIRRAARARLRALRDGDNDGAHRGSGLGLAMVKGFVEASGGRVWAESLPGQGTVFVVELPLAAEQGGVRVSKPVWRVRVCDDELQICAR